MSKFFKNAEFYQGFYHSKKLEKMRDNKMQGVSEKQYADTMHSEAGHSLKKQKKQ